MRVLILGGSGLLGRSLFRHLHQQGYTVFRTYSATYIEDGIHIDMFQPNVVQELARVFQETKPDICINCIVQRFTDICEKDWTNTKQTNIDTVEYIKDQCIESHVHLIHISTDYVYDGFCPPYNPRSQTNPLQNYGISKLIAENRIRASTCSHTIIRVPVLYSDELKHFEDSAVSLIAKKVLNRVEITSEENISIRRPVFVPDVCHFIECVCKHPQIHYQRILHFYNDYDAYTKYEIAQEIGRVLHKDTDHIHPINTLSDSAKRPHDTCLVDTAYDRSMFPATKLTDGLRKCLRKIYHTQISQCTPADVFILLDLDGTLINTERLHYDCYFKAIQTIGNVMDMTVFSFDMFLGVLNNPNTTLREYLYNALQAEHKHKLDDICELKKKFMLESTEHIDLIPGMDKLLNTIITQKLPHAVVTNTNKDVVKHFQTKVPLLQKLSNWITKEDYDKAKPAGECYQLALQRFYQNQTYIIGFENTISGFKALQTVTNIIYIVTQKENPNYAYFKTQDVYLIKEYRADI